LATIVQNVTSTKVKAARSGWDNRISKIMIIGIDINMIIKKETIVKYARRQLRGNFVKKVFVGEICRVILFFVSPPLPPIISSR